MLELPVRPRVVLCLGAHSDDIEIGCGATLRTLIQADPSMAVHWVVFSGDARRAAETRAAGTRLLAGARTQSIEVEAFRDGWFPWEGAAIKERVEDIRRTIEPDLIFTHYREDRHQDHRTLSDLAWNTFRNHLIVEYEVPKYDGDFGNPNGYVAIADDDRRAKIDVLMECFGSQHNHDWFTPETFNGLMRLRGIECASPTGYAEAFHMRKFCMMAPSRAADVRSMESI